MPPIFNLVAPPVRRRPFEHVLVDDFIDRKHYDELVRTFPQCPPSTGPTGYSLYWGDGLYEDLIARNFAWHALFQATQSQRFVDYCLTMFRAAFAARSTVDVGRATYVAYRETREDKERRHILAPIHAPHELWVRTDIHQGQLGYRRAPHVDHRRRLVSMLIYLCDGDECGMEGGDLVLHGARKRWWDVTKCGDLMIRPRHNRMAAFPCHAQSLHSVPEIVNQAAPRNFLQITVSSSFDAWAA